MRLVSGLAAALLVLAAGCSKENTRPPGAVDLVIETQWLSAERFIEGSIGFTEIRDNAGAIAGKAAMRHDRLTAWVVPGTYTVTVNIHSCSAMCPEDPKLPDSSLPNVPDVVCQGPVTVGQAGTTLKFAVVDLAPGKCEVRS